MTRFLVAILEGTRNCTVAKVVTSESEEEAASRTALHIKPGEYLMQGMAVYVFDLDRSPHFEGHVDHTPTVNLRRVAP